MGTFLTITSLETIMFDTTFDTATTALANECVGNAENKIREILANRYDVSADAFQTTTSTPPVISTICKWLSVGYMYEDLSRGSKDAYARADRYIKKAMDNLTMIQDYKADVLDSTGSALVSAGFSLQCNTTDYHDTFDEGPETAWGPDSDKLDDISDARS